MMVMHGGPKSDEVRKSMFETLCHTCVAALVVIGATILAFKRELDPTAWAAACGTAIAASGAVTVVRRSEVDRPAEHPDTPQPLVVVDRRNNDTE